MPRNKKVGRNRTGGSSLIVAWRFLSLLPIVFLLVPIPNALAAVQNTSGKLQLSNALSNGSTTYSVDYSYPSTAEVGTNLTITMTLNVVSLTGQIDHITDYRLIAYIYVGTQFVGSGYINSSATDRLLYPGASWGPNNVTVPLTAGNAGIAKGASANASVSIALQDKAYFVLPAGAQGFYQAEPLMQGLAGDLLIQNAVASTSTSATGQGIGGQTYVPYVLLASGAVLMFLAVVLPRGQRLPEGK